MPLSKEEREQAAKVGARTRTKKMSSGLVEEMNPTAKSLSMVTGQFQSEDTRVPVPGAGYQSLQSAGPTRAKVLRDIVTKSLGIPEQLYDEKEPEILSRLREMDTIYAGQADPDQFERQDFKEYKTVVDKMRR